MQQLSILDHQPEPELMEAPIVQPFNHGQKVIAAGKPGKVYRDDGGRYVWIERDNVATPHDRPTVQPYEPATPVVNQYAITWQEGNIAYYRRIMLRFMEAARADNEATPAKQAARRHMIRHLHGLCEACLDKIKQLGGE